MIISVLLTKLFIFLPSEDSLLVIRDKLSLAACHLVFESLVYSIDINDVACSQQCTQHYHIGSFRIANFMFCDADSVNVVNIHVCS